MIRWEGPEGVDLGRTPSSRTPMSKASTSKRPTKAQLPATLVLQNSGARTLVAPGRWRLHVHAHLAADPEQKGISPFPSPCGGTGAQTAGVLGKLNLQVQNSSAGPAVITALLGGSGRLPAPAAAAPRRHGPGDAGEPRVKRRGSGPSPPSRPQTITALIKKTSLSSSW